MNNYSKKEIRLLLKLPDNIKIVSSYKGRHKPIKLKCKTHGMIQSFIFNDAAKNKLRLFCDTCREIHYDNRRHKALRKAIKLINIKFPNIEWVKKPTNLKDSFKFTCSCSDEVKTNSLNTLKAQKYCCRKAANKEVNKNKIIPFEEFRARVYKNNKSLIKVARKDYSGMAEQIKYTCLECGNIRESRAEALVRKRKHGCLNCSSASKIGSNNKLIFNFSGKTFKVSSKAEYMALLYLKADGYTAEDILDYTYEHFPIITYNYKKTNRLYIPDFYIPSKNLVIEVKGDFEINRKARYDLLLIKRKACIDKGYKFKLINIHRGLYRSKILKGWQNFSHEDYCKMLKTCK